MTSLTSAFKSGLAQSEGPYHMHMLSYCRHSGAAIHGHAESDHTTSPDTTSSSSSSAAAVVLGRLVSGVEWRRPLTADWTGTAGLHWQRTSCMGDHGQAVMQDCYGCPLTYSGKSRDTMVLTNISAAYR